MSKFALIPLFNALLSIRLGCCNSLYNDIAKLNLQKLQKIQNAMAWAITKTPKHDHTKLVNKNLLWLPLWISDMDLDSACGQRPLATGFWPANSLEMSGTQ